MLLNPGLSAHDLRSSLASQTWPKGITCARSALALRIALLVGFGGRKSWAKMRVPPLINLVTMWIDRSAVPV